jgi:lambda repressor-like predicted transcriptional regulator
VVLLSNLVFRNGAYGIPKADHHRARVSAKGKEKAISLADRRPRRASLVSRSTESEETVRVDS